MATTKGLADFRGYLRMVKDQTGDVASMSPPAMRAYLEDRLRIVEGQMQVQAQKLHRTPHGQDGWWSATSGPPDDEFCDCWSSLLYLTNTREQLVQTLRRL